MERGSACQSLSTAGKFSMIADLVCAPLFELRRGWMALLGGRAEEREEVDSGGEGGRRGLREGKVEGS